MPNILLPRTRGCLVCGRDNPHGLRLQLAVDPAASTVHAAMRVEPHHAGFNDVAHGGLIATVADEAMAWASAWAARRFGLCGELVVRFRRPAIVGTTIRVEARVDSCRPRLVTTTYRCTDADGNELSTGTAKYVPMSADQHATVVATFLDDVATRNAAAHFTSQP